MMSMSLTRLNKGALKKFAVRMPRQANFIVSKIAARFAEFVRDQYLSGQVLRERSQTERARSTKAGRTARTRSTKESTRFFKIGGGHLSGAGAERRTIRFGVRPGSRIRGRLNYLLGKRFERGERPFMAPAWKEFRRRKTHMQIARGYMDRFIREENRGRTSG